MSVGTDRRPGGAPRRIPPAARVRAPRAPNPFPEFGSVRSSTTRATSSPRWWEYAAAGLAAAAIGLAAGLAAVDRLTPKPVTSPPFSTPVIAGKGPG